MRWAGHSTRFLHIEDLVCWNVRKLLRHPAGPANFYGGSPGFLTQPEMRSAIARRQEPDAHCYVVVERPSRRSCDFDLRANGVAITLSAFQFQK